MLSSRHGYGCSGRGERLTAIGAVVSTSPPRKQGEWDAPELAGSQTRRPLSRSPVPPFTQSEDTPAAPIELAWKRHELEWLLLLLTRRSLRDIAEERKVRVGLAYAMRRRLVEKLRDALGMTNE